MGRRPSKTLHGAGMKASAGGASEGLVGAGAKFAPRETPVKSVTGGGLESGAAISASSAAGSLEATLLPPPLLINPTVYSTNTVIIQNSITINVGDPDVRELKDTLGRLVTALEGNNELLAEVRHQLSAEISAGKALLSAPKVERNAIQLYLISPLRWIVEKVGSVVVTELAKRGLELLLKHFVG
jgi:hypothetical protein